MKKLFRIISIVMVLTMILTACQTTQTPAGDTSSQQPVVTEKAAEPVSQPEKATADSVKVGILLPMTGQDALNGEVHLNAFKFAAEEINASGGIACLGGAPVELVVGDTQGKPKSGNAEAERLITKEGVIALIGAFHSGVTLPATEISERYEVPFIAANAIAGSITARGLKYVFKPRISVQSEAQTTVDFVVDKGVKKVALMTANITIGEEARKAWENSIEKAGLELVNEISYPSGSPDFSDAILSIKSANPEVVFALGNTADAVLIVRQMKELGYWPTYGLVTAGGGFSDASLIKNLGVDAEGIFVTTDWSPTVPLPGGKEINERFKAKYGLDLSGGTNTSYASLHLFAAAVEKACSTDPKALAEILRSTNFEKGMWNFMFPKGISFDETGYIKDALVLIAQIQDGQQVAIWPAELSVGEEIWPVPSWDKR